MRRSVCSTMSTRNQMFLIYRKMLETDADPPPLRAKLHTLSAKKLTERREFVRHNDANISNLIKLRKKETFRLNSPIAAIQDPSIVQSIDSSTFSKTTQQTILEATTIPKTPSSSVYSHIHTLKNPSHPQARTNREHQPLSLRSRHGLSCEGPFERCCGCFHFWSSFETL